MTSGKSFARLDGLSAVPAHLRGGVVAIGNFDGCHRGHQAVFAAARDMAAQKGVPALVLTFEPHPRDLFAPKPFLYRLTDAGAKARLVQTLGFDAIAVMAFSRDLAGLEAHEFVTRYLVDALAVSGVVIGADFHFGKGRAGTPDFLEAQGRERGFDVSVHTMIADGEATVSSSRIRGALASGDIATANALFGYRYFFSGTVIAGDKRGRDLGYPTANVAVPETFGLRQGVYAVRVRVDGAVFSGVSAFGKPMFGNAHPPFETFIFDFDRDIYGRTIDIALIDFIREQMTFEGLDSLIAQMDEDTRTARITTAQARPLSPLDAALGFVLRQ